MPRPGSNHSLPTDNGHPAPLAPSPFAGAQGWWLGIGFWTVSGLLQFSYQYLDVFVRGDAEPFHIKLIEELTGSWGAGLLLPLVFWAVRRWGGLGWRLLWHVPALVAFSVLHTSWNWASRVWAFSLLGVGPYDYGNMPLRYAMEFGNDVLLYGMFAALAVLLDHYRAARARELQLAALEAEVTRARLSALEARLQPHFLFNALHTISSVMYEDVAAADTMITRLSSLLRRTLATEAREVPLAVELETVELWASIMEGRFGDRLQLTRTVPAPVQGALVPPLILQPLLENAVKHGDPGPGSVARVILRAERAGPLLVLEVEDNGPGLRVAVAEAMQRGVGLATTRRRLETMYPGQGALTLAASADGGLCVRLTMPWREGAPGDPGLLAAGGMDDLVAGAARVPS